MNAEPGINRKSLCEIYIYIYMSIWIYAIDHDLMYLMMPTYIIWRGGAREIPYMRIVEVQQEQQQRQRRR